MISAVMLNWARKDNVTNIVNSWRASALIDDAVIWNNNPQERVEMPYQQLIVINSSHDMGVTTRFNAALLTKNNCILIQDDDLLLPANTLEQLYERWKEDPLIIHGLFGRRPQPDGTYGYEARRSNMSCDIVLTRALLVSRLHIAHFFTELPFFADILDEGVPKGNGEDIVFSYVVKHRTGKQNRVYDYPLIELPAHESIHKRWPDHKAHRTKIVQRCQKILA